MEKFKKFAARRKWKVCAFFFCWYIIFTHSDWRFRRVKFFLNLSSNFSHSWNMNCCQPSKIPRQTLCHHSCCQLSHEHHIYMLWFYFFVMVASAEIAWLIVCVCECTCVCVCVWNFESIVVADLYLSISTFSDRSQKMYTLIVQKERNLIKGCKLSKNVWHGVKKVESI